MNHRGPITTLIAILALAACVPVHAQDELIHDRMDFGEHPEFRWHSNLVGWLSYFDGLVAGLPDFGFRSGIISGIGFDSTLDSHYFIARFDRNAESKFYIGYSIVAGRFSNFSHTLIDYGVFVDSTGVVYPSWDDDDPDHWSASLPEGIYDMRLTIDRAASTMTVEFDSVAAFDSPMSDFTSPELSVSDPVELVDILYIQMNFYNHFSAVYDVWSVKPTPSILNAYTTGPRECYAEGDTIAFTTYAVYDGEKELFWEFEDPRFERDGDIFRWVTSDGDGGTNFSILRVTDGHLVDSLYIEYAVTQVYDSFLNHDHMGGYPVSDYQWYTFDEAFWFNSKGGYLKGSDHESWTSCAVSGRAEDLGALRSWVFRVEITGEKAYALGLTDTHPDLHNGRHNRIKLGVLIEGFDVKRAWYSPSTQFEDGRLEEGLHDIRITWDPAVGEARFEAVPVSEWPDSLSDFSGSVWTTYADCVIGPQAWIQASVIGGGARVYDLWSYVPADGPEVVEGFEAEPGPVAIELSWSVADHDEAGEFVIYRCPESFDGCGELASIPLIEGIVSYGYLDSDVLPGETHQYRVYLDRGIGLELLFETGLLEVPVAPAQLYQNWPNPFNPGTRIGWYLPEPSRVRITIFDAAGRRVRLLIDEKYEAGENSVEWDGTLDGGGAAASGVYFYRIEAGSLDEARKMVLLR
jgi:hypothetical protein